MKKVLIAALALLMALCASACAITPGEASQTGIEQAAMEPEQPTAAPEQAVDGAAIDLSQLGDYQYGTAVLIAELEEGLLYSSVLLDKSATCVYIQDADSARIVWEREGEWSLLGIEETLPCPYVFFLGTCQQEGYDKYTNALYCYDRAGEKLEVYLDKPCSNATSMVYSGTEYEGLIVVLWGGGESGDVLIPINVLTGETVEDKKITITDVSFFTGIGDWGTHLKCVIAETETPYVLKLMRVLYDEDSKDVRYEVYTLDVKTGILTPVEGE